MGLRNHPYRKKNAIRKGKPNEPRARPAAPQTNTAPSILVKADSGSAGPDVSQSAQPERVPKEKVEFVGEALYRLLGGENDPVPVLASSIGSGQAEGTSFTASIEGHGIESHAKTDQPPTSNASLPKKDQLKKTKAQKKADKKKKAQALLSAVKLTAATQIGVTRAQRRALKLKEASAKAKQQKANPPQPPNRKTIKREARHERQRKEALANMSQAPDQNDHQDRNQSANGSEQAPPQGNLGLLNNGQSPPPFWNTSQPNAFQALSPFAQPWTPQGFGNFNLQNTSSANWPGSSSNVGQSNMGAFSPNNGPFLPFGFPAAAMPMFNGMSMPSLPFPADSNQQRNFSTTDARSAGRGERSREPKKNLIPTPIPTPEYLAIAHQDPKPLPAPQPILLVMDLNGTLVHRPKRETSKTLSRPHIASFLSYLFSNFTIMVWSSAKPPNVDTMCAKTFTPEQQSALVARWSRTHLRLSQAQYNTNVQVYKHLSWIWDFKHSQVYHPQHAMGKRWDATNTILLDDSVMKAASEPHNLLQVSEFKGERTAEDETMLEQVVDYLEEIRGFDNVAACMRKVPFKYDPDWKRDDIQGGGDSAAGRVANGQ